MSCLLKIQLKNRRLRKDRKVVWEELQELNQRHLALSHEHTNLLQENFVLLATLHGGKGQARLAEPKVLLEKYDQAAEGRTQAAEFYEDNIQKVNEVLMKSRERMQEQ